MRASIAYPAIRFEHSSLIAQRYNLPSPVRGSVTSVKPHLVDMRDP
jgi:hypothetical protein